MKNQRPKINLEKNFNSSPFELFAVALGQSCTSHRNPEIKLRWPTRSHERLVDGFTMDSFMQIFSLGSNACNYFPKWYCGICLWAFRDDVSCVFIFFILLSTPQLWETALELPLPPWENLGFCLPSIPWNWPKFLTGFGFGTIGQPGPHATDACHLHPQRWGCSVVSTAPGVIGDAWLQIVERSIVERKYSMWLCVCVCLSVCVN